MTQLFEVSREEKIAALAREIELRERVYPRYVSERKMTKAKAEREIEIMKAILADYAAQQGVIDNLNKMRSCPHGWKDWDDCPVCCH